MNPEIAARLAALRIEWFGTEKGFTFFTRDYCAAIAQQRENCYSIGSSGVMTEAGFAYLVWRDGSPYLAAHGGNEAPAAIEQVEAIQRFSADLKTALA